MQLTLLLLNLLLPLLPLLRFGAHSLVVIPCAHRYGMGSQLQWNAHSIGWETLRFT